ncbi:MAG: Uma2 family endonuclease [Hyphomicrobiaceae bacterium]|nr:MAG: Uma2 family endonuclease [Hyphomicrobiaceae bacterium]
MNVTAPNRMTVDEFLRWCQRQERGRFELQDGRVIMQQAQTWGHAKLRMQVYVALTRAIARQGAPLFAAPDGMTVRIDEATAYEPDALIAPLPEPVGQALEIPNPVVVVEVLSPSSEKRDLEEKVAGYARVPTIEHYLILDPGAGVVMHLTRATMQAGAEPRRVSEAVLRLDPPGIELAIAELFPRA